MNVPQNNYPLQSAPFPPGWYQDPWNPAGLRWWDGMRWIDATDMPVNYHPGWCQGSWNYGNGTQWVDNARMAPQPSGGNGSIPEPRVNQQQSFAYSNTITQSASAIEASPIDNLPAIKEWIPSGACSALGVFTLVVVRFLMASLIYAVPDVGFSLYLFMIVFAFIYVLAFYRSYFTEAPVFKSSRLISFMNYFITGPIFGWCLNRNLAKSHISQRPDKGISFIVYVVLGAIWLLLPLLGYIYYPGQTLYVGSELDPLMAGESHIFC